VARTRTTKKLAQRIDLNYFKRPTPLKRARLALSLLAPALALVWIAWHTFANDHRVFSSGRMSAAHAVLEQQCAVCHVQKASAFSAKAADSACLSCHDGPVHHANQVKTLECAVCHTEHRGRVNISATSNQSCAECHSDLKTNSGGPHYQRHIRSFEDGHPEFAALREGSRVLGAIKLNHAIHMKAIRRGPTGPIVQPECADCHRSYPIEASWNYADTQYMYSMPSYRQAILTDGLPKPLPVLKPRKPSSDRALMIPVEFGRACAGCHLLTFDKRFDDGVPHDKTEVVHTFLVKKFQNYIAMHPSEVRVTRDPNRDLTGKPMPPEVRVLSPAQWVTERTAEAETLLWRKTCKQCHTLRNLEGDSLPVVASSNTTMRWMPHAKFDHDAHGGFTCVSCHAKALTSTESSDILLPGIATCQTCHAPGPDHAESRCFECHTYHDWSKRKEVRPNFTLPALHTGGQAR
jgi:hypothetical protein